MSTKDTAQVYEQVREHYSTAARAENVKYGETVAKAFGYADEDLVGASQDANLGLSCGNPLVLASLRTGETVIDLGSGAGFDVFLAAPKVGPTGHVYGIDMNDDMLARAEKIKATRKIDNVTFVKAEITSMPLDDGVAECIISNCVINLVPDPDKPLVFNEMFRLLKPGGRVAVSDILAKQPLPQKLRDDVAMYVGCIAGASLLIEYEKYLKDAGFTDIIISDTKGDLNVYLDTNEDGTKKKSSSCCGSGTGDAVSGGPCGIPSTVAEYTDLNEWVGSYKIYAMKPASG